MVFYLSTRSVLFFLISCICVLLSMDALLLIVKFGLGHGHVFGLNDLFSLDAEQNIPTLFSTLDLMLASALLWVLYRESLSSRHLNSPYWLSLSFIFALLAVDEFASLHERLNEPLVRLLHTSGALRYAWVIPYGLLMIVFAAAYFRFWWNLPARIRFLIGSAGMVYVSGALGMELVGAKLDSIYGWHQSLAADIEHILEEGMEMFGVALFVYALLELLRDRNVRMRFVPNNVAKLRVALINDAHQEWNNGSAEPDR